MHSRSSFDLAQGERDTRDFSSDHSVHAERVDKNLVDIRLQT
jgi:hypothetical protein